MAEKKEKNLNYYFIYVTLYHNIKIITFCISALLLLGIITEISHFVMQAINHPFTTENTKATEITDTKCEIYAATVIIKSAVSSLRLFRPLFLICSIDYI